MSLTSNTQLTLMEAAKREHNGKMLPIAEILTKINDVMLDAVWLPANDKFSNITNQRYSLATGTWRNFNAGVLATANQTKNIVDKIGMLEDYSESDVALTDSMASPEQFRNDENAGKLEGMSQTIATTMFYGNGAVDTEKFTGFAPRLPSLATNVLGCGGTGGSDLTSMFLVQWGADKVHMIYPEGSAVGLEHKNLGEQTKVDSSGYMWQVYRDHFKIHCGLVVRNPRCIARVCNIETSGTANIWDEDNLIKVIDQMHLGGRGAVAYVNRTLMSQIRISIKDKANVFHSVQDPYGPGMIPAIFDIPIRMCEAIVNTESTIS